MALSRAGHLEEAREAGFGTAESAPDASSREMLSAGDGGPVVVTDAALLRDGDFLRHGGDLLIRSANGAEAVVQGYFTAEVRPNLMTAEGDVALTPGLVESFLSAMAPGQYAQKVATKQSPIGQVDELKGAAFAERADGTRVQLSKGDPVFEGDIVETGGGDSAIRMVFVDKTMFALGSDARLALDKLVFDPSHLSGASQFSILKGVFIFASGEIAKNNNTEMMVVTPVAAVGIRGTEVAGRVDGSNSQFTIIDGAIEVTTQAGSVMLDDAGETTFVSGIDAPPSEPQILSAADYGAAYGGIAGVAPAYFTRGFEAPTEDHTDGRGGLEWWLDDDSQAGILETAGSADYQFAPYPDIVLASSTSVTELLLEEAVGVLKFAGNNVSPFRTETLRLDTFWNPYLPFDPYGTIMVSADSEIFSDIWDTASAADVYGVLQAGEITGNSNTADDNGYVEVPIPPANDITLTLSNATDGVNQILTNSFVLKDLWPNSTATVFGSAMGLPGVGAGAQVDHALDGGGKATVNLASVWDSIKNIRASSDTAADISITNFVHADVSFGNGGDSDITIDSVERGFISTGDGNDRVDIKALTSGGIVSKRVVVDTGSGDDTVIYQGSPDGLSELTFLGGQGIDTMQLMGSGQSFDLSLLQYNTVGVEHIDVSAAPNATVTIGLNLLTNLLVSGVNGLTGTPRTLVVSGAPGDQIQQMSGLGWIPAGSTTINGDSYTIHNHISGVSIVADDEMLVV